MKNNQLKIKMAHGGPRQGSGRPRGAPNKITAKAVAKAEAGGEMPKDYMLRVMRDPTIEHERRDRMANAVAPYYHPKLASTEHTGKDGGPIAVADVSDQKRLAAVALLAAREALKGANRN